MKTLCFFWKFVFFALVLPLSSQGQILHNPGELITIVKEGTPIENVSPFSNRSFPLAIENDLLGVTFSLPEQVERKASVGLMENGKWAFHWEFRSEKTAGISMVISVGNLFLGGNQQYDYYWINEEGHGYSEMNLSAGDLLLKPIWGSSFHLWLIVDPRERPETEGLQFIKAYQMAENPVQERSPIGFGKSFECHKNVNCPEGAAYQSVKKGVCKILMPLQEGLAFCSGSLLNNTSQQAIPYVLTAYHCDNGYTPFYHLYEFIFAYESEGCPNPSVEPGFQSVKGAEKIAAYPETDARLFKITASIPSHFDLYLNGWTRDTAYAGEVALIHHPMGDIKKISIQNEGLYVHPNPINWSAGYQSQPYTHLRATFDSGTQQPGSSGSSLFNAQGKILGQLHGGLSSCVNLRAFIGRFNLSWDQGDSPETRLRDWLDPEGLNPVSIEGRPYSNLRYFDVFVVDGLGNPMTDSISVVFGFPANEAFRESNFFRVILEPGIATTIRISMPGKTAEGIEGGDLEWMRWILLKKGKIEEFREWAADVNMDGVVDNKDLEELKMVFLEKDYSFSSGRVWRFSEPIILVGSEEPGRTFEVQGAKLGDINFSLLGGE